MDCVYFATSSDIKFNQYLEIFKSMGVTLIKAPIYSKMIEPQIEEEGDISNLIVEHPLKMISRFVKIAGVTPYMVEDTMLFIESLSTIMDKGIGLPGGDTKNWWKNLGNEGLLRILRDDNVRRAMMVCTLGAIDHDHQIVKATHKVFGTISREIRSSLVAFEEVPLSNPYFFHQIFIPEGTDNTYAEMTADVFCKNDYRRQCAKDLVRTLRLKEDKSRSFQLKLF